VYTPAQTHLCLVQKRILCSSAPHLYACVYHYIYKICVFRVIAKYIRNDRHMAVVHDVQSVGGGVCAAHIMRVLYHSCVYIYTLNIKIYCSKYACGHKMHHVPNKKWSCPLRASSKGHDIIRFVDNCVEIS